MKNFEHLITLLPCYSLDDFPVCAIGDEANGLLTAWTTPWHPALIAMTGRMPQWCRTDDLPDSTSHAMLFLPGGASHSYGLPEAVSKVVNDSDCELISEHLDRTECLHAAFAAAGLDVTQSDEGLGHDSLGMDSLEMDSLEKDLLARDFLALGYWYLQVQMLTRQMHYTSNIDTDRFADKLVAAAKLWQSSDIDNAREQLASCYNLLSQERDHYYPVDSYLIDLTLVAESTTPAQLMGEFKHKTPINVWLTASTLERLATSSPEAVTALRHAIEPPDKSASLASVYGGEIDEAPLSLLAVEDIVDRLESGGKAFEQRLGTRPKHFGRRRFGMTARLPHLLDRLGYLGVVHPTLDDGRFPEGSQTRTRWSGFDGTSIEAIAGVPCDATLPETFLRLAMRMGESMESDFVATVCLAHWAGHSSPWYDDLRAGTRYGLCLGRFATLERFFADTAYTGQLEQFSPDRYRSPFLKQAVAANEPDPVSRWTRYWHHQAAVQATRTIRSWAAMLNPRLAWTAAGTNLDPKPVDANATEHVTDEQVAAAVTELQRATTDLVPLVMPTDTNSTGNRAGKVLINPTSAARRSTVQLICAATKRVYAMGQIDGKQHALVDVPPHGFAWVQETSVGNETGSGADSIASETITDKQRRVVLRNEFCEVRVDPLTGGIVSIYDFHSRGNRLSQQLGLRQVVDSGSPGFSWKSADQRVRYSTMKASRCEITSSTVLLGEIVATGSLYDKQDKCVAEFQQTTRLRRGSRLVELQIQIQPCIELTDDPWNTYFASRFAWSDESSLIYRDVSQSRQLTAAQRIESPLFVEIESARQRTAILTGGLPYHRRVDRRQLDTILITKGETQTDFRLAIGVDCRSLVADAWAVLLPDLAIDHAVSAAAGSSWLFHINARHVVATYWSPRIEKTTSAETNVADDQEKSTCTGFVVRLLETLGRDGEITLQSFQPIKSAQRQDFLGEQTGDCHVSDGVAKLKIKANEWTQIEVRW